jgi:hypothetical protein
MFERANGMLQSPRTPGVFAFSQMKDEIPERDLLGNLECPLDLIHRIDATALLRMNHVHRRRPAPPHLRIGIKRCVHRERLGRIRPEPFREFADVRPTGVIEVLPRGKQLHALCSGAGKNVQQAQDAACDREKRAKKWPLAWMRAGNWLRSYLLTPRVTVPPGAAAGPSNARSDLLRRCLFALHRHADVRRHLAVQLHGNVELPG